jgi:multimeric flavodoxin WrbA
MKILAISCSPRKQGNTEILLDEVLKGAQYEGAEVELFSVAGKSIAPCDACDGCVKQGICHIKDDMQPLYEKMLAADGIIFGTPIYYYNMAAQCKTIMDRTIALNHTEKKLTNKVGGIVVVAGSLGSIDAVKDLYFYFVARKMLAASYVAAYAIAKGDVKNLEKCMKAAYDLGRQVAALVKMNFKYPSEFNLPAIAYGTHTR